MTTLAAKSVERRDSAAQTERSRIGATSIKAHRLQAANQQSVSKIKVKADELILFATQLSVMLDSGVILSDALDSIAESCSGPKHLLFNRVIVGISETVKTGENLSKALRRYPRVFSPMFISMVKASEASGKMVEMLSVLSEYLSFELETRKRIKSALTYPFIMAIMAVAATGSLMFFVLPRFMKIYDAKGVALPKLTQILVGLSKILGDFFALTVIVTTVVLFLMALFYWSSTIRGKRSIDFIKIRCPVLGTMFIDMLITRSMRIMTTMISTGVNLLDTIEVIRDSCENCYFQEIWASADEKIRDGYQLSESISLSDSQSHLSKHPLIAPGVIKMLQAGESSGKLGQVTEKISFFYEKKLKASIKTVMTVIEPLMITILGGIIGTIAIALLLPVFKISTVVAH